MSDSSDNSSGNEAGEAPLRISGPAASFRIDDSACEVPTPHFEQPSSQADFDFWSRMPIWTVDEAVALSFDRNPEFVTWESLQGHLNTPFVESFRKIRKLAMRAVEAGMLFDPCPPTDFIDWSNQNGIAFSAALGTAVFAHTLLRKRKTAETRRQKESSESSSEGQANLRSFNTLLKLVGGLAVAVYKYDPTSKKSDVTKQIQSDLDLIGVTLDLDTIRKWMREGVRAAEICQS